jgi:hypothetical protein
MRKLTTITLISAALMLPATAHSQWNLSIGGGASLPTGNFGRGADPGWHALASIGLSSLMQPMSLRADIQYGRFDVTDANQAISSGTLNLAYRFPSAGSVLAPYVIFGGGMYRFECVAVVDCDATHEWGWNGGLGTRFILMGMSSFLEARIHLINDKSGNVRFVPITLGFRF